MRKQLYRPMNDRYLFGVLAGLANYFEISPKILRIVYLIGCFLSLGVLVFSYFLLAAIIPSETTIYRRRRSRTIRNAKKVK